MSARTSCATARVAPRVAAVVLIAIGVAAAAVTPSEALGLPNPTPTPTVAEPLTPVTRVVDQLTRPLTGAPAPAPALPAPPSGRSPGSPSPGGSPERTAPAPSGGQSTPSARARAGGDDLVAVDAEVEGLLGLCVRIPSDASHPRADVVVLDRDVLAVLAMAGVPVRDVITPCPAGVGATPAATGAAATAQAASAGGGDPTTGRLAFTGAEVVPNALLAAGLLWLGVVFTLTSRRLVVVRQWR